MRSISRDSDTRVLRSPVPSPARGRAARPIPSDPVVPFVLPTNSGWATSHGDSVRKVASDVPFHVRYRSGRTSLPNLKRDNRFHRIVRPVGEPLLTVAEHIGRRKRDGYFGRRVAAMVLVRRPWDKNLDRSTAWVCK